MVNSTVKEFNSLPVYKLPSSEEVNSGKQLMEVSAQKFNY